MTSPFLTTADAARFLCFVDDDGRPNREALRQFLLKHPDVPTYKRGRSVLLHRDDLQALIVRTR